ncbi:hypothetical protein BDR03DRAFT_226571 [Suillus americanus]|nr:hypothetical protein BDR03DRAFT_226571 [Suillus americanus]
MHGRQKMSLFIKSISELLFTVRSLKMKIPVFNLEHFSAAIPLLSRLTNIEVAIHQLNAVPRLLALCPNLLSLTIGAGSGQRMQYIEPFTHPTLQSLRINIAHDLGSAQHLPGLFNALSLPNLRFLHAYYIVSYDKSTLFDDLLPPRLCELGARYALPRSHAELKALLARSNCPLECLNLGGGMMMMTDEQRAEYVALIPSLDVVVDPIHRYRTLLKQT